MIVMVRIFFLLVFCISITYCDAQTKNSSVNDPYGVNRESSNPLATARFYLVVL